MHQHGTTLNLRTVTVDSIHPKFTVTSTQGYKHHTQSLCENKSGVILIGGWKFKKAFKKTWHHPPRGCLGVSLSHILHFKLASALQSLFPSAGGCCRCAVNDKKSSYVSKTKIASQKSQKARNTDNIKL